MAIRDECRIEDLRTRCFRVPTDAPESDGTLDWDHTTMVLVTVSGGVHEGLGYTYASSAAARVVNEQLRDVVPGGNVLAVDSHWNASLRGLLCPGCREAHGVLSQSCSHRTPVLRESCIAP